MIIKIFAGIGMACMLYIVYILLQCDLDKFKIWRKTGYKIKMLCKPHNYDFYYMLPNNWELTLKCKKYGKIKKLYVDVEALKRAFDEV